MPYGNTEVATIKAKIVFNFLSSFNEIQLGSQKTRLDQNAVHGKIDKHKEIRHPYFLVFIPYKQYILLFFLTL